ncbi:hypothetical protein GCM10025868_10360 [Angustibacter aerolatus]|uniref:MalQ N-terminal beta-sandwich domain-containing protein n=1 Tax=Angustibacter aerolatus TaxID=1162965 RepID=A0ABQ6JDX9_9ACTN|nr:hypothetical protein GCM10025868_10360 [Angustibacter aerolatus]
MQQERWVEPRVVDGGQVGEASFEPPADLPLGWHRLRARVGDAEPAVAALVVTPDRLTLPASVAGRRAWGVMTQAVPGALAPLVGRRRPGRPGRARVVDGW